MAIYIYNGYISKEEAARQYKVQVRTINDWIRKTSPAPADFVVLNIDGYECIKDRMVSPSPPQGFEISQLEWIKKFAKRHAINFERMYVDVVKGKLSAVVIADRVFVNKNEPALIEYTAKYKRKRSIPVPFYLKYPKTR